MGGQRNAAGEYLDSKLLIAELSLRAAQVYGGPSLLLGPFPGGAVSARGAAADGITWDVAKSRGQKPP